MLVRTLAIEERRRNDRAIVVALRPGTVDTQLSRPFQGNVQPGRLFTAERAALQLLDVIEGLTVPDSGKLFDFQGQEVSFQATPGTSTLRISIASSTSPKGSRSPACAPSIARLRGALKEIRLAAAPPRRLPRSGGFGLCRSE